MSTQEQDRGQGGVREEQSDMEADALEQNVKRLLRSASAAPRMSEAGRARVLSKLVREQARRTSKQSPPRRPLVSRVGRGMMAGAGIAALAAGAWLWMRPARDAGEDVVTYGNSGVGPREVVLRDGSKVTLDEGAVVVERAPRDMQLVRGQAVFEVMSTGRDSPVAVRSARGRADVIAPAKFWMRAGDTSAEVVVARGEVHLGALLGGGTTLVRAGQEGSVEGTDAPRTEAAPRMSHFFDFARTSEVPEISGVEASASRPRGTLTARDPRWGGEQPLLIRAFDVDVVVEDGFARTTVDQTYFNPRERQLEGTYTLPMPRGAAISRLAMYVDGTLMEGAIVGRSEGRDIYEGIVEARRDPALLEWMSGNTFRMRVFPLPARTEKRIFLSYTQPLEHLYDRDRLVVPIPHVDQRAARAHFKVRVVGGAGKNITSPSHAITRAEDGADEIVSFSAEDYELGQDLVLSMGGDGVTTEPDWSAVATKGADTYAMVRHSPDVRGLAADPIAKSEHAPKPARRMAVLFDASASRTRQDLAAQARFVDGLLDALDYGDEVVLITAGYDAQPMPGGLVKVGAANREEISKFLASRVDGVGSTNLRAGLEAALKELGEAERGVTREVVYLGDGVEVDAGVSKERTAHWLPQRAGRRANGLAQLLRGARFLGVGIGDTVDRGLLDALADATHGMSIAVGEDEDLKHRAFDLVAATYAPCIEALEAQVLDAKGALMPRAVAVNVSSHACDGERVEVVVRAPRSEPAPATIRVRGTLAGKEWVRELTLAAARTNAAYLPRVFAERRIASLLAAEPPGPGRAESPFAAEITALAKEHFLVTPFTSLLVLENDKMYEEFKVEKKKPTGWALYDAPAKIEVRSEPVGRGAIAASGAWDFLERSPTELFQSNHYGLQDRGFIGLALSDARPSLGLGSIGAIGRSGQGFGGGGRGRLGGRHQEREPTASLEKKTVSTKALYQTSSALPMRRVSSSEGARQRLDGAETRTSDVVAGLFASTGSFAPAASDEALDGRGWMSQAYAGGELSAFRWFADEKLDDLTELVPSMFTMEVDTIADFIAAQERGSMDESARALLDGADRSAYAGSFRSADGTSISFRSGAHHQLERSRVLATGLREKAVLEDGKLELQYEELGLRTRRDVGVASVWWSLTEAPWALPTTASLEGLVVESVDARTVRIRAPGVETDEAFSVPTIEIELNDKGHVTRVSFVDQGRRQELRVELQPDRIVVAGGADKVTYVRDASVAEPSPESWVDVEIPLSNPARWEAALASSPSRTDELFARRQLLATYAALADDGALSAQVQELEKRSGRLTRGELALASRAIPRHGLVAGMRKRGVLASGDPVADYLLAREGDSGVLLGKRLAKLADTHPGSLVGMLGMYRATLLEASNNGTKKAHERLVAFGKAYPQATFFRYAAARAVAEQARWNDDKVALAAWDTLLDDAALRPLADRAASQILQYKGDYKQAADRAVSAFETGFDRGYDVTMDWQLRSALQSARGPVGFDLFVARWRSAVLARGNATQLAGLLRAMLDPNGPRIQDAVDIGAILRRLDTLGVEADDEARLMITRLFVAARKLPEAKRALAPLLDRTSPPLRAVELASGIAEAEGDLERTVSLLDRLLRSTEEMPIELEIVRGWYTRLVDLHMRSAGLAAQPAQADASIAAAVAVAARWRREDPDNANIDELCARALYRMGRVEEARRHLYSIVERRPAEGSAWGRVATMLDQQGDLDAALAAWETAAAVEPENPTWQVSRAQILLVRGANGDHSTAKTLLDHVIDHKWQDRYWRAQTDARNLLSSFEK